MPSDHQQALGNALENAVLAYAKVAGLFEPILNTVKDRMFDDADPTSMQHGSSQRELDFVFDTMLPSIECAICARQNDIVSLFTLYQDTFGAA